MSNNKIRQYGLWESPITPLSLSRGISFSDAAWDDDGTLVWREQRSDRGVIVIQPPDGQAARDLNSDYSIRAGIGYGGGDFTVGKGHVYFIEAGSGRIYKQPVKEGTARAITPEFGSAASPVLSPDGKFILFVHSFEGIDNLAIIDSEGENWPQKLVSGEDFYMQPTWSPNGDKIAWVAWNHPNMPWDGTYLRMARIHKKGETEKELPVITDVTTLAGDENTSVLQPLFSPDGRYLSYISDKSGWWQLYLYDLKTGNHKQITSEPAEYGIPAWLQGMRTYDFSPDGKSIFIIRGQMGFNTLWKIRLEAEASIEKVELDERYTSLDQVSVSKTGKVSLLASGVKTPPRLISFQPEEGVRIWRRAMAEDLPDSYYSAAQSYEWIGLDGNPVYGLYYPPTNPEFEGKFKPPLIVHIHGGPTSQVKASFNSRAYFFTSRGYAFLEVNYRGSTGYGREYRNALRGSWGIYDVQDAVSGAQQLSEQGLVDPDRMVIMGGSAGGFTVLKTLEDYPGKFKAGICLYGVSNQFDLAAETHKFESHYTDSLLGPLPEAADLYKERSPVFFCNKINDPIIIFQGEEDKVVPQNQSDSIVADLRRRGVPHEYHLYPGEGHGFRKTETIEHFYNAVLEFLKEHVIFA
jgi:dipeptidyl aminopeptidase/acylaminoacyl peptidase